MLFIYPWNMDSKGARVIRNQIPEARIIKHNGSTFVGSGKTVLNWGASSVIPEVLNAKRIFNHPDKVVLAANKLKFFRRIDSLKKDTPRIPATTTDLTEAIAWVTEGHEVIGRAVLEGHSGEGILFSSDGITDQFKQCKLFVRYVKKKEEYRVHIAFGKLLYVQRKALRTHDDHGSPIDPKTIDWRIRNLNNGFIFQRNDVTFDDDVIEQAQRAIRVIGLDFGAVDVIWNEHENRAYVLEINTAPGLEGTSITDYASAFRSALSE